MKQSVSWLPSLLKQQQQWQQHHQSSSPKTQKTSGNASCYFDPSACSLSHLSCPAGTWPPCWWLVTPCLHLLSLSCLPAAESPPRLLTLVHFLSSPWVLCFLLCLSCLSCSSILVIRKCLPLPGTKSLPTLLNSLLQGISLLKSLSRLLSSSRPAHSPVWPDLFQSLHCPMHPASSWMKCLIFDVPLIPYWLTHSFAQRRYCFVILLYPPKHTS